MAIAPRITPFLWFDDNAVEAVEFYTSIFPNSSGSVKLRNTDSTPGPTGKPMTVAFTLDGQPFTALNGGPIFKFNEAVSFVVHCDGQAEIDYYWERLTANGGNPSQCGWLKDQFGLSWQVVPANLPELLAGSDKAMAALMKMGKIVIADLQNA